MSPGSSRERALVPILPVAVVLLLAFAATAQAQDISVVGDWRYIGQSDSDGFAWNASDIAREGPQATVSILRTPLTSGPFHHEITTVVIDCEERTYRVIRQTSFDAEGLAPPSRIPNDRPRPLAGPPAAVEGPVCKGLPQLTPGKPVSASVFSTGLREYINSGAAAWAEANPRR